MGDNFVCVGQKPTRKCPAGDVVGTTSEQTLTNKTLAAGTAVRAPGMVQNVRVRATAAQVNATGGLAVLPALAGYKYRMVDCKMIAVGGAAGGATGVQIKCDTVLLVDAKVAALGQSVVARAGDTNVNVLADGASFATQAAGKSVVVIKDGSDLTTATHIDVILDYVIET